MLEQAQTLGQDPAPNQGQCWNQSDGLLMDAFLWASSNILNVNTVYKCKLKAKLMSELKPKE